MLYIKKSELYIFNDEETLQLITDLLQIVEYIVFEEINGEYEELDKYYINDEPIETFFQLNKVSHFVISEDNVRLFFTRSSEDPNHWSFWAECKSHVPYFGDSSHDIDRIELKYYFQDAGIDLDVSDIKVI